MLTHCSKFVRKIAVYFLLAAVNIIVWPQAVLADLVKLDHETNLRGVYFLHTPDSKQIFVYPVVVAGEADFDGPQGLSHYLEHIMYWHANKVDTATFHGRSGNAWVNGYVTAYFNSGSRQELDDMFEFSRRILTLPELDKKFMLEERDVVLREYDFRVSESPDRRAWSLVWPKLLPDNPVSRSVIGTPNSIASLTLKHAFDFHREHYNPANVVLLITGNLSNKEVIEKAEKYFGGIEAGDRNSQDWRRIQQLGEFDQTMKFKDRYVAFPALAKASVTNWKGTGDLARDMAVMKLATAVLASNLEGGLAKPLKVREFVFSGYDVGIFQSIRGQAQMYFQGRLDENISHEFASKKYDSALKKVTQRGVKLDVLNRVRKRLVRSMQRQANEVPFVLQSATNDISHGLLPLPIAEHVAKLESVTLKELNQLFQVVGTPQRRIAVHLKPE